MTTLIKYTVALASENEVASAISRRVSYPALTCPLTLGGLLVRVEEHLVELRDRETMMVMPTGEVVESRHLEERTTVREEGKPASFSFQQAEPPAPARGRVGLARADEADHWWCLWSNMYTRERSANYLAECGQGKEEGEKESQRRALLLELDSLCTLFQHCNQPE